MERKRLACFQQNTRDEVRYLGGDGEIAGAITAEPGAKQQNYILADLSCGPRIRRLMPSECEVMQGFPDSYTLVDYRGKPAADGVRQRVLGNSMATKVMRWIGSRVELSMKSSRKTVLPLNTMTMLGRPSDDLKPRMGSGIGTKDDPCPTITKSHSHGACLTTGSVTVVRGLTPSECESLQGFQTGYTAVPFRGSSSSDTSRQKSLGNSMAVACMRWIGVRIESNRENSQESGTRIRYE